MTLHEQFVQLGKERHKLTYRLLKILPQIYKEKIYQQKGYTTIYEYAGKLAGLSKSVVQKVLRTEKHLENKPTLKKIVEKEGIHKVALVAKLATPQDEKVWAKRVENMSKASLFELAKEVRNPEQPRENLKITMDEEMEFLFLKIKKKFGKSLNHKEAMRQILKMLNQQFFPEKKTRKSVPGKTLTRNIPATKKREALTKTAGRCAHPKCNKPYDEFHHVTRFSESPNHSIIVPLCRIHHEFMHNKLIKNESAKPENWTLNHEKYNPGTKADQLARFFKTKK